ncbi:MAE_28990/MAE_18760 family HEPN-like nuclease [Flavobacterium buctense]|uniref:MAE_28990/MAE_18760 family HEPN-like nuclease n=1 Tax=Flavobacterium buctense TaxID=1648146 RepID=A0ABU9E4B4_9FLAO|nr:MAE_28990/MAE_18760 family HEPN-like nuclease [Flavobacterium buctense]
MLKIRTKEHYFELLEEDFSWRKKELTLIKQRISLAKTNHLLNSEMRAGILLLYAHWEGFIKTSCNNYLNFVKYKRLNYSELPDNLLALSLKSKIHEIETTGQHLIHTEFITFFKNELNQRASWSLDKAIDTKSNLNSDTLKNILSVVGIPYTDFELKSNLIDEQLLKNRNTIAHGNGDNLDFDKENYLRIHQEIFNLLQVFYAHLTNLVVLDKFKIP